MRSWPVLLGLALLLGCGAADGGRRFVSVRKGDFRSSFVETGELQAVHYTVVSMPPFQWEYGQPKIVFLEKEGLHVRPGDVVGLIDTTDVVRVRNQKQADLAIARADFNKLKVGQKGQRTDLEGRIRTAETALAQARINARRVTFEPKSQQEVSRLKLREAELTLRKLREKLETLHEVQAEDRLIQEAKISRIESAIARAQGTIARFILRAPSEGIIEYYRDRRSGKKTAVGDALWPGRPILGLPDLSRMKALTPIDETDIDKVHAGQSVSVRLDAFPDDVFSGMVTVLSKVSRQKDRDSRARVFDVEILLEGSSPILRPGMTVGCEFVVADLTDALFVDSACLHREAGGYAVYVKKFFGLRRVGVTLGPRNAKGVVVRGDLEAGDRVAVAHGEGGV